MKKTIIICAAVLGLGACADNHIETTYGCNSCGAAYAVKTASEVIDHYQVYQPVTTYRPAGTFTTRRTVANDCGYNTHKRRTSCTY